MNYIRIFISLNCPSYNNCHNFVQTVVRSVSAGETLVNGAAVSVAALRHGDEVTVGGRTLRWEYNEPKRPRPLAPQPGMAIIINK